MYFTGHGAKIEKTRDAKLGKQREKKNHLFTLLTIVWSLINIQ